MLVWILFKFYSFSLLSLNYLRLNQALRGYKLGTIISFRFNFCTDRLLTIALVNKLEPALGSLLARCRLGHIRSQLL